LHAHLGDPQLLQQLGVVALPALGLGLVVAELEHRVDVRRPVPIVGDALRIHEVLPTRVARQTGTSGTTTAPRGQTRPPGPGRRARRYVAPRRLGQRRGATGPAQTLAMCSNAFWVAPMSNMADIIPASLLSDVITSSWPWMWRYWWDVRPTTAGASAGPSRGS